MDPGGQQQVIDYDQIVALYLANTEIIIESLEDLKGIYRSSLDSFPTRTQDSDYYYQYLGSGLIAEAAHEKRTKTRCA